MTKSSESEPEPVPLGDMSADDFRRHGRQIVEWIATYLSHPERHPVLSKNQPDQVKHALPSKAPERGEAMEAMLADLDRVIVPGVTHWNHPGFLAYFATSGSAPGILGEMLSAAFNVNAMLWRTSPSATELEEVTLGWLRQLIGLPEEFEGVIYDTASISTLCAIAAAREAAGLDVREKGMGATGAKLRLYASEHVHSSVDKSAITLGIPTTATMMFGMGETRDHRLMHFERLRELQDRNPGFVSFIPWTLQPDNTPIGKRFPDRIPGDEYLRWLAIGRLYLDNIPNVQASWLTQGLDVGRQGLHYGANDLGSTMIEENVITPAGANHRAREISLR